MKMRIESCDNRLEAFVNALISSCLLAEEIAGDIPVSANNAFRRLGFTWEEIKIEGYDGEA